MVVKVRNKLVKQPQLQKMMQGPDQPIRTYVASLKATARTCGYKIKCTDEVCDQMVNYTNTMVLQQMIMGLADKEIQSKLLAKSDLTMEEAEMSWLRRVVNGARWTVSQTSRWSRGCPVSSTSSNRSLNPVVDVVGQLTSVKAE